MKFVVLALFVAGGKGLSIDNDITVTAVCLEICPLGTGAFF